MLHYSTYHLNLAMHVAMDIKQETLPVVISHSAISFALYQISLSNFAGAKMKSIEPTGTQRMTFPSA